MVLNGCIYLITNIINNKGYIGQSRYEDPLKRYNEHWYSALNRKTKGLLYNAMRKYGKDNFKFELLCICPRISLNNMESYWAEQLETYMWDNPGGYNMVWCGNEMRTGIKHTIKTKKLQSLLAIHRGKYIGYKISKALKGRKWSQNERKKHQIISHDLEFRKKIGNFHKGKIISQEQRKLLREAMLKWWTSERKHQRSESMKGRKHSEESKNLMSIKQKGKKVTPETREKLRKANLGKKASEEAKTKMSIKRKGFKISEETKTKIGSSNKGKHRTEEQKLIMSQNRKKAADEKFKRLFYDRLELWKINPKENKQWRYDMSRKYRDNTLLQEYIDILEKEKEWTWSSKKIETNSTG
jgi:group I intron endonuclease